MKFHYLKLHVSITVAYFLPITLCQQITIYEIEMCFRFDQSLLQWFKNLSFYDIEVKCKLKIQLFRIILLSRI